MKSDTFNFSEEEATKLCDKIFENYRKRIFLGMQCRMCRRISTKKNDITLRCYYNQEGKHWCNVFKGYLKKKGKSTINS